MSPQEMGKAMKTTSSPAPGIQEHQPHPYDFHVSGPRNLSTPTWRDLITSSWKDPKYKRMVMACFIQAVYLLELDRQEKRDPSTALAPKWWKPFRYKLTKTLIDERDGSIYGAILEWDYWSGYIPVRPAAAPRAVLALRGTLLKTPSIRRDLEDDLRFLAWESLKGSVRFDGALQALKSAARSFGSANVCVAGHSLGAGFALQVGKALAKEGVFVECHVFNPPSVSLVMSLRSIGERAGSLWNRVRAALPLNYIYSNPATATNSVDGTEGEIKKILWVPNLYVNNSDYICCYYTDTNADGKRVMNGEYSSSSAGGSGGQAMAKLFVMSKGPQKFLEAHGLEQWWADDMELQSVIQQSKLINRQLRSLYTTTTAAVPTPLRSSTKQ